MKKPTDTIQRVVGIETLRELVPSTEIYLTPRMFTMMILLMKGNSYKEIAMHMNITESTVQSMARNLREGTGELTMARIVARMSLHGCVVTNWINNEDTKSDG